jgi:hypothetical protein
LLVPCSAVDKGFRSAALLRWCGADEGYLGMAHGGPRMYINLEDYLYYNT